VITVRWSVASSGAAVTRPTPVTSSVPSHCLSLSFIRHIPSQLSTAAEHDRSIESMLAHAKNLPRMMLQSIKSAGVKSNHALQIRLRIADDPGDGA
jgi:hypothetical protein